CVCWCCVVLVWWLCGCVCVCVCVCVPLVDAPHDAGGGPEGQLGGQHHLQQEQVGLLQLGVGRRVRLAQSVQLVTGHTPALMHTTSHTSCPYICTSCVCMCV